MSSRGPAIATVMPKPCLKQADNAQHAPKHAHFPPPSEEARRYSGIEYDRTPIAIATNDLALPARGCPGRTFDDLDAHHYRHHLKKLRCHKQQLTGSLGHSGHSTATSEGPKFVRLTLAPDSGSLPCLIHGDTSESEGDEMAHVPDGEGLQRYPNPVLVSHHAEENGVLTSEPKRLRKLHHLRRNAATLAGRSVYRADSTFASYPGSDSCLGGF